MKVGGSFVSKAGSSANPIVIAQVPQDATATVGAVLSVPAPLPLTRFTASSDGTTLTITLS